MGRLPAHRGARSRAGGRDEQRSRSLRRPLADPGAQGSAPAPDPPPLAPAEPSADWRRLALVFAVATFIETVGFGHFVTFMPLLVRQLGATEAQLPITVGFLSTAAFVAGLPLVPFWGAWADRYSRKAIVVRSAFVEMILFLLLGLAGQVWQLFVLVPLAGLVLGNTGVMLSELSDRAPRRRLAFAISIVGTAGPLGIAVGPALGGLVADRLGVQSLFLIDGVLSGLVVLLLLVAYHERPDRLRPTETVMTMVRRSLHAIARTPLARNVFLAYLLLLLGQRLVTPYLALWVQALHGTANLATVVGLVAGAYGLASAIGAPSAASVADRVGYRRIFGVGVVLAGSCLVLAGAAPGLLAFAATYAFFGMGFATASSMIFTLLASGLPSAIRSSVLNLAMVPLYLSGVLGSLASAAFLAANGGDLQPLWVFGGAITFLALVPIARLRGSRSGQVAEA
ncbi:MAG: MFS transporter [Candidatus Limnocylindrales bacterium]